MPAPASRSGGSTRLRRPASPVATPGASFRICSAPARESWITGSYDPALNLTFWGTAQAKPWMPVSRGMSPNDDALYSSSTRRARRRYGQARLAFSARPRRSAGSRRRLRAPPRRRRQRQPAVHGRQGRHPLEARSEDRTIPRPHGNRVSERLGRASIPRPAGRSTGRTSSSSRSSAPGYRVARAPRAGTTGRRRAITRRPIS